MKALTRLWSTIANFEISIKFQWWKRLYLPWANERKRMEERRSRRKCERFMVVIGDVYCMVRMKRWVSIYMCKNERVWSVRVRLWNGNRLWFLLRSNKTLEVASYALHTFCLLYPLGFFFKVWIRLNIFIVIK